MKPKTIRIDGQHWRFYWSQAVHVGVSDQPRHITGWTLVNPDGYERFSEGNWTTFVPWANQILANHGCPPVFS